MSQQPVPEIAIQMFELKTEVALKYGINLQARSIQLTGEIDGEMFNLIDSALTLLEEQSKAGITIKINSQGGALYEALAIVGRMKASKCKITTEGYGSIMSAAALIMSAGDKRRMSSYATFMFHEASGEHEGTIKQLKHNVKQLEREWDIWCGYMDKFSACTKEFWLSQGLLGEDLYLTAGECFTHGVVDEVF